MRFADPNAIPTAFLILRHLYDGDIIDWPIPDDHPQRDIFQQLEAEGYVARWDRVWPLHDRYRLTEKGIATIEAVYQPAGSEAFFEELRRQNLRPADRRAYLQSRRLDPNLWPVLHDPSTHWSTWYTTGGLYQRYLWEDHHPPPRRRPPVKPQGEQRFDDDDAWRRDRDRAAYNVDLDRRNDEPAGLATPDYDVS
ncbi:MAG: hypothetical protein U0270_36665 [Labilithrix sp.]